MPTDRSRSLTGALETLLALAVGYWLGQHWPQSSLGIEQWLARLGIGLS